jgi:hypothetical protein
MPSSRQLAKFAGLLASVSPAVSMSELYLHGLYQNMTEVSSWDEEFSLTGPLPSASWPSP